MNFSALKDDILHLLSNGNTVAEDFADRLVDECLHELDSEDSFRFTSAQYTEPLPFLKNEPYSSFLAGSDGYYLVACTLGISTERKLARLSVTNMPKMVVYDACAGVYLEYMAEERKNEISRDLSYIFCPGYAGSSVTDLKYIFERLHPETIGITLTESGMMMPQKSIVGIAAHGTHPEMRCGECVRKNKCELRKEGKRCFRTK